MGDETTPLQDSPKWPNVGQPWNSAACEIRKAG